MARAYAFWPAATRVAVAEAAMRVLVVGAKAGAGVAKDAGAEAEARAGAAARAAIGAGARGGAVVEANEALPVPSLITCFDDGRQEGARRSVFTTAPNRLSSNTE